MIKTFTFNKEETGRWYIDLPDYLLDGGVKADLEMVMGADKMLDIYAQDSDNVTFSISDEPFSDNKWGDTLTLVCLGMSPDDCEGLPEEDFGAVYQVSSILGIEYNFQIWLCPITKYVFDTYPKNIYIK